MKTKSKLECVLNRWLWLRHSGHLLYLHLPTSQCLLWGQMEVWAYRTSRLWWWGLPSLLLSVSMKISLLYTYCICLSRVLSRGAGSLFGSNSSSGKVCKTLCPRSTTIYLDNSVNQNAIPDSLAWATRKSPVEDKTVVLRGHFIHG